MKNIFSDNDRFDSILRRVERPSRYIGGEWNARSSYEPGEISADICLCYPDLYEIGASAPGMGLLYSLINNSVGKFAAQRCYAPSVDFFNELKKNEIPLFSLETKKPLADFDAVGFTLQHELSLTNVLYMLDAAGIPFRSHERFSSGKKYPLIIGGGPLTLNPEPFADFFDVIIVGDAEEAILELMDCIASSRNNADGKYDYYGLMKKIALGVRGAYVPSFYEAVYDDKNFYKGLKKREPDLPDTIDKRIYDIRRSEIRFYASPLVVPTPSSVHARLVVEIARGCPHRCSFCSARVYYGPWRVRKKEDIVAAVREGLRNTGYDEVSFASLSSGDYPDIEGLLKMTADLNVDYPLSLAIPSIHCEKFTPSLAATLAGCSASRPSLTFAPETGRECLRFSVGKKLADSDIFSAVRAAADAGWKQAKFYFMYGLPGETDADIKGIIEMVRSLRKEFRNFGIKVALSPFVPKPHTVFERERFEDIESLRSKFLSIKKVLGGAAETHLIEASFIEALIARGDRTLSRVIERAYKSGARFDQWREGFSYEKWIGAFQAEGIDPFKYVNRFHNHCGKEGGSPSLEAVLPWSHISVDRRNKNTLVMTTADIYNNAVQMTSPPQEGLAAAPARSTSAALSSSGNASHKNQRSVRFRIRMSREGLARFISNNDQIEVIRRSVRRARLPVVYSSGFHPQPKISFGPAVSVGYESRAEYFEAELSRYIAPQEVMDRLNSYLPAGYRVLSVKQVPTTFASFESMCGAVEYSVKILKPSGEYFLTDEKMYSGVINEFMARPEFFIDTEDGRKVDIRALVRELALAAAADASSDGSPGGRFFLRLIVNIIPGRNIKPEKIVKEIFHIPGEGILINFTRERFFAVRKKDNTIFEI